MAKVYHGVRVFDLATATQLYEITGGQLDLTGMRTSCSSSMLAVRDQNKVSVRDSISGTILFEIPNPAGHRTANFYCGGSGLEPIACGDSFIAILSTDAVSGLASIYLHDVLDGSLLGMIENSDLTGSVTAIVIDGSHMVVTSYISTGGAESNLITSKYTITV